MTGLSLAERAESTIESMLYGRDEERWRIRGLLDAAREGSSGVLVLRGEAGVGKSALLADTREQAADMVVLGVEGIESEAQLPYAGLHQMVRPVLDRIDALPAPQARALRGALGIEAGSGDEWFLVSAAVLSLLAEAAEQGPVVCLIDDAHWLDAASAESLVFAARRLEADGVAMLFAAREGEVRSFEAPGLPELHLRGLDPDAAGALLDRNVDVALSPHARRRLIEETGGNPLGLIALASSLSEAQLTGAEPLLDPLPVSARVERVFLSRVRGLPAETQTLLLVAAAEETGELATVLPAAARLGADLDALDVAEREALLRVDGAHVEFRHPLVRSAVYHGAPLSKRRAAHRALADALAGEADADRRAWHLAAGCIEPDDGIASELEHAARRAQRRSGFVAGSIAFERAAAITRDEHHRLGLLTGAVECAWFAGRLERAATLLERARPLADEPLERAELDKWRGAVEATVGVPAEAREMFVRGATDLAAADPDQALYLLAAAAIAAGYAGDVAGVARIAALAAEVPGAESASARFLVEFLRGAGEHFTGAFEDSARHLRRALELVVEVMAAPADTLGHLLFAGGAALFLGDDEAAERFNRRLAAEAREVGALSLVTQAVPRLALSQLGPGSWASAAADLADGLELAEQTGQHQVRGHILSVQALIAGHRGDEERCRRLAAQGRELAAARRLVHVEQTCSWALLSLELGRGDAEAALLRAREIARPPITLWAGPDRIEAAVRADAVDDAREWLVPFEAWAASTGAPWARGAAAHCQALLVDDEEAAERLFGAALDAHAGCSRPFERARAELAFGEFLRRGRRRVEAREHLRAALDRFETLGARAWAERAHGELRASGQTARRRDPSTRDDLSPQEIQIARLVAQGLSNRTVAAQLYLSPRTIDYHLRNVFRKLGITSRTQLANVELSG